MNKTVWVVEKGSYSDYRVVGVFSSEVNAQVICDKLNAGDPYEKANIAEWPLDPAIADLRKGYTPFEVWMAEDGGVELLRQEGVSDYHLAGSVRIWRRSQAPFYKDKGIKDVLQATVWAKDGNHAIKIVNEHRTCLIASGEWASGS